MLMSSMLLFSIVNEVTDIMTKHSISWSVVVVGFVVSVAAGLVAFLLSSREQKTSSTGFLALVLWIIAFLGSLPLLYLVIELLRSVASTLFIGYFVGIIILAIVLIVRNIYFSPKK